MGSQELREACCHEAGHALAAFFNHVAIVSVCAKESGHGLVLPEDLNAEDPWAVLLVAHAGVVGENIGCATPWHDLAKPDLDIAFRAKGRMDEAQKARGYFALDQLARDNATAQLREHRVLLDGLSQYICERANTEVLWKEIEAEIRRLELETTE
jgi:hypothetical protein